MLAFSRNTREMGGFMKGSPKLQSFSLLSMDPLIICLYLGYSRREDRMKNRSR
jgi:hypothetical protein